MQFFISSEIDFKDCHATNLNVNDTIFFQYCDGSRARPLPNILFVQEIAKTCSSIARLEIIVASQDLYIDETAVDNLRLVLGGSEPKEGPILLFSGDTFICCDIIIKSELATSSKITIQTNDFQFYSFKSLSLNNLKLFYPWFKTRKYGNFLSTNEEVSEKSIVIEQCEIIIESSPAEAEGIFVFASLSTNAMVEIYQTLIILNNNLLLRGVNSFRTYNISIGASNISFSNSKLLKSDVSKPASIAILSVISEMSLIRISETNIFLEYKEDSPEILFLCVGNKSSLVLINNEIKFSIQIYQAQGPFGLVFMDSFNKAVIENISISLEGSNYSLQANEAAYSFILIGAQNNNTINSKNYIIESKDISIGVTIFNLESQNVLIAKGILVIQGLYLIQVLSIFSSNNVYLESLAITNAYLMQLSVLTCAEENELYFANISIQSVYLLPNASQQSVFSIGEKTIFILVNAKIIDILGFNWVASGEQNLISIFNSSCLDFKFKAGGMFISTHGEKSSILVKGSNLIFANEVNSLDEGNLENAYFNLYSVSLLCVTETVLRLTNKKYTQLLYIGDSENFVLLLKSVSFNTGYMANPDSLIRLKQSSGGIISFVQNAIDAFVNKILFGQGCQFNIHSFERNIIREGAAVYFEILLSESLSIFSLDEVLAPSRFKVFQITLSKNVKISLQNFILTSEQRYFAILEGISVYMCSFSIKDSDIVTNSLPLVKLFQSDFNAWVFENTVILLRDFESPEGATNSLIDLYFSSFNQFNWEHVYFFTNQYFQIHTTLYGENHKITFFNSTIRETNEQTPFFQLTKILKIIGCKFVVLIIVDSSFFESIGVLQGNFVLIDLGEFITLNFTNCNFRYKKSILLSGVFSPTLSTGINLTVKACMFSNCTSTILITDLSHFAEYSVTLKQLVLNLGSSAFLMSLGIAKSNFLKTFLIEETTMMNFISVFLLDTYDFGPVSLKLKSTLFYLMNDDVLITSYLMQAPSFKNSEIMIESCSLIIMIFLWRSNQIFSDRGTSNNISYKNIVISDISSEKIEFINLERVLYFDGYDKMLTVDNVTFYSEVYSILNFIVVANTVGTINIVNLSNYWFKFRKEAIKVFFPTTQFFINPSEEEKNSTFFLEKIEKLILHLNIIRSKIVLSENMATSEFLLIASKSNISISECLISIDRVYNKSFVYFEKSSFSVNSHFYIYRSRFKTTPFKDNPLKISGYENFYFLNFLNGITGIEFRDSIVNLGYFRFNYFARIVNARQVVFKGMTFVGVFIIPPDNLRHDHVGSLFKLENTLNYSLPTSVIITNCNFISVYSRSGCLATLSQNYSRRNTEPPSELIIETSYFFDLKAKQISSFLFFEPGTGENELEVKIKNSFLKKILKREGGLLGGSRPKVTSQSIFYRDSYRFLDDPVAPTARKISAIVTRTLKISSIEIDKAADLNDFSKNIYNLVTSSSLKIENFVKNALPKDAACHFYLLAFDDDRRLVKPEEFDRLVNLSPLISEVFQINFKNINGILCAKQINISSYVGVRNMGFSITKGYLKTIFKYLSEEQEDLNIILSLQACKNGEKTDFSHFECLPCPKGTYSNSSFIDNLNSQCLYCDDNKNYNCYGANIISPKSGFWRFSVFTENFLACPRKESCIGDYLYSSYSLMMEYENFFAYSMGSAIKSYSDEKLFLGTCEKGYKGIMCTECDEGLGKFSGFICYDCSRDWKLLLQQIIIILFKLLFIFLQIYKAMDLNFTLAQSQAVSQKRFQNEDNLSTIITVSRDHFQVIFLINKLAKVFSSNFQIISFSFFSVFSPDVKESFSSPCVIKAILNVDLHVNYISLYFTVTLHMFLVFLFSLRKSRIETDSRSSCFINYLWKIKNITLLVFFIQFVGLLESFISQMFCIDIDKGGMNKETRLLSFFEISCHDNYHERIVKFLSLPGIFVIGVLSPAVIFMTLRFSQLFDDLDNPITLLNYGYFYYKFKRNFIYFGIVLLIFRISYTLIGFLVTYSLIFEKDYQQNSLYLLMILCMLKYFLTTCINPYNLADIKNVALIEKASFKILIFSIFLGVIIVSQQESRSVISNISAIAFYLSNALFLLFIVRALKGWKSRFLKLRKIFDKIRVLFLNLIRFLQSLVLNVTSSILIKGFSPKRKYKPKETPIQTIIRLRNEADKKSQIIESLKKEVEIWKINHDLLKQRLQNLESRVGFKNYSQPCEKPSQSIAFNNKNSLHKGDIHALDSIDDGVLLEIQMALEEPTPSRSINQAQSEVEIGDKMFSEQNDDTQSQKLTLISKTLHGNSYYNIFLSMKYAVPKNLSKVWNFSKAVLSDQDWCLSASFEIFEGILTLNFMKMSKWVSQPLRLSLFAAFEPYVNTIGRGFILSDISLADFLQFEITVKKEPLPVSDNNDRLTVHISQSAFEKLGSIDTSGLIVLNCPLLTEERQNIIYKIMSRESIEIWGIGKFSNAENIIVESLLNFIKLL